MSKHFISFLGTGKYDEVVYKFGDGSEIKNKFVQIVLIDKFCLDYTNEDKFTIFLTEEARSISWESEGGLMQRLVERGLEKLFDPVNISDGTTEKEMWDIFSKIYESIRNGDELIIDVTHGFRSLPMLAVVVLNYARTLKKFELKGMYYGAIDMKISSGLIIDLAGFDKIFQWSAAINDFNKYGIAGPITKLLQNDSIEKVSKVLTTIRGQQIVSGEIFQNCKDFLAEYRDSSTYPPPFEPVFGLLKSELDAFQSDCLIGNIVASIDWYVKHRLVQQGITMLQEGILTILIYQIDSDYRDLNLRDKCSKMLGLYQANESEQSLQENLQKIKALAYYKDLGKLYQSMKDVRNSINHGGFTSMEDASQKQPFKANSIIDKLEDGFKNLKKILADHKLWGRYPSNLDSQTVEESCFA
jgi:CRISPR-associated Csx2 family protein